MVDFELIKLTLKSEFIGIDHQIDNIIDIIKPWYDTPDLYDTPLIVNLWGMTGHGKTSLINRIIDLMGEHHNKLYMNCHSMIDMDVYYMESFVEDNTNNNRTNKFIIFDDFQYVRTIDEDGKEHSSSALSVMWNLMDVGTMYEPFGATYHTYINAITQVLECVTSPDDIQNGVLMNTSIVPSKYFLDDARRIFRSPNCPTEEDEEGGIKSTFFIDAGCVDYVRYVARHTGFENCSTVYEFVESRLDWDAFQWREFFNILKNKMKKGLIRDFHNSIIFVIGNIDEAFYGTAKQVNPEMDADQVREITSTINIVDIKKALQKRFRNEQIARLGNTHIIYPSFSKKDYEDIIAHYLTKYAAKFEITTNARLDYEASMYQCIYNEGVFPSQGVRPLFSTINDIVKCTIPKALYAAKEDFKNKKIVSLKCGFDTKTNEVYVTVCTESDTKTYRFNVYLRVRNAYKVDTENQASTSVHESGHFILYKYLTGNSPVKVVSRSLESSCLGYMMEKFDESVTTYDRCINEIIVCLGGFVAEELIFGLECTSNGSGSDIEKATNIAAAMCKDWGFGSCGPIKNSCVHDIDNEYSILWTAADTDATNIEISGIVNKAHTRAIALLKDNPGLHAAFLVSCDRLNAKGELTEDDIKEISSMIEKSEGYSPISETYFADTLQKALGESAS